MALSNSLSGLSTREAIADALYRCVNGIDTADSALFDSAFIPSASFENFGKVSSGLDAIHADMFDNVSKLDTTHFITNVRIDVKEGATTATMTASALAQHYREGQGMQPGATRLLGGALYNLELVTDEKDGLWKIKAWRMRLTWAEGDMAVVMPGQ